LQVDFLNSLGGTLSIDIHFTIEENSLSEEEFISLSKKVGWGKSRNYDMNKVKKALSDTSLTLKVVSDTGAVVGCARAFSDDLLMTFIPDIFVCPDHQSEGIGSMLVNRIKEKYGHTNFFFGAQPGNELFFEKLGFEESIKSYTGKFRESPYWS
jgi:GNAT superfamily N-acetyltransferase